MDTVNFQCGHCGKLMAVSAQFLGQQVRCPHCQQVVVAPAAASPNGQDLPALQLAPAAREQESIFSPPEEASEDLFGAAPAPRLEIPQEPPWAPPPPPSPEQEQQTMQMQSPPMEPMALGDQTVAYVPPSEPSAGPPTELDAAPSPFGDGEGEIPAPRIVRAPRSSAWGTWLLAVFIVPLISYSILVTILLFWEKTKPAPVHPMEMIPDAGNANPPAHKGGKASVRTIDWGTWPTKYALPDNQMVPLGSSVTVGQVKVTPTRVELRPVMIRVAGYQEVNPGQNPALVLFFDVENVSSDVFFYPLDPQFYRRFASQYHVNTPFTFLEKGQKRWFGGTAKYDPAKKDPEREFLELHGVDGDPAKVLPQNLEKELGPGEKMSSFVCTDTDRKDVAEALANYDGPLTYRVQVRRGLVPFKGQERSATTVIGVTFTGKDVQRPG